MNNHIEKIISGATTEEDRNLRCDLCFLSFYFQKGLEILLNDEDHTQKYSEFIDEYRTRYETIQKL